MNAASKRRELEQVFEGVLLCPVTNDLLRRAKKAWGEKIKFRLLLSPVSSTDSVTWTATDLEYQSQWFNVLELNDEIDMCTAMRDAIHTVLHQAIEQAQHVHWRRETGI